MSNPHWQQDVDQENHVEDVFEFDEKSHVYKLNGKRMTGVTTLLGVISKPSLIPWAARMATEYVKENALNKDALIGEIEKVYWVDDELLEKARTAHAKKKEAGAEKGTDMHAEIEEYVKWFIEMNNNGRYRSFAINPIIQPFVDWAKKNSIKFLATEKRFYSKSLFVAGTADLIFEKDGRRYVGDVKTFKKLWDRTPMFQCAGYALLAEEMGEPKFDGYCVLRLSEDGTFEEKWSYDVEGDTKAFLACVELYRQLNNWV